jgi:hypothetical protein
MGGPTSSYSAAGIALEFLGTHKTPHPATNCFRQGGDTIKGEINAMPTVHFTRYRKKFGDPCNGRKVADSHVLEIGYRPVQCSTKAKH